jgi:hypothetical protein
MTTLLNPGQPSSSDSRERDFDYGIGDDLTDAARRARLEVAARIREAARDARATAAERQAYERAARIAESGR